MPWQNTLYEVYRKAPGEVVFTLHDTTSAQNYTDAGLQNGAEYCYYIKSIGSYSASGFINPIENLSQQLCASPLDTVAPCPPLLTLASSCDDDENLLSWQAQALPCATEVMDYKIYYKPTLTAAYALLATLSPSDTTYLHGNLASVAGCYYITATDSAGNESVASIEQCADNCPGYSLPNVFTPNNDGVNDVFRPFPYKYVESIDFTVYNRWGVEVFSTTNPDILWKGTVANSDKPCSSGVYYYVCTVNEITLNGIVPRQLAGTVTLFMEEPVND